MPLLQRLTTEYIEKEDRVRISGEGKDGELESFWLSQRLLIRLIRHLVSTFEESRFSAEPNRVADTRTIALVNEMAQQVAQQILPVQAPVVAPQESDSWLVLEVDVSRVQQHIKLVFRNSRLKQTELMLDNNQLRQWLSILFQLWQKAEWPMSIWPDWIVNTATQAATRSANPLH